MTESPRKVRQFCYFWIASKDVSAEEITEALGMTPDQTKVRGSRRTEPTPVPVDHAWDLVCDRHDRIEDQATEVLARIEPVAERVRLLTERGDVEAGLTMVRYFDDSDGRPDAVGWWLTREQVSLLAKMRASIQADEYLWS